MGATTVLLLLAAFGTLVSLVSFAMLCDENCAGGRPAELSWQLVAACAGLVGAIVMTYFADKDRWRAAVVSLTVTVVLYAAWAVLLDAATHGWGSGPVPL